MSAESLSPNQVENLLKAMETAQRGDGSHVDGRRPGNPSEQSSLVANRAHSANANVTSPRTNRIEGAPSIRHAADNSPVGPVTRYDFRHPERIGKDQMHAMWALHESIASNFAAAISRLLRVPLSVKLVSLDSLTYQEFTAARVRPSCIGVFRPAPLVGNWLLDIAPSLAFLMIDRMLGGDAVPGEPIQRPLTEIENRLMARVVALFLEQIGPAWKHVVELQPELESIVSTPHRAPITTPEEFVIQIELEVRWGKNCGLMTLCIPCHTIQPYRNGLATSARMPASDRTANDVARRRIAENMDGANVDVVVTLARSRIKTSDLMGLAVGDIITTEKKTDHPLELAIQNIPKFHASAGAYQGKKAVQVQAIIDPGRRRGDGGADTPHNVSSRPVE